MLHHHCVITTSTCPTCGRCPTCGHHRPGFSTWPWRPQPVYPIWVSNAQATINRLSGRAA